MTKKIAFITFLLSVPVLPLLGQEEPLASEQDGPVPYSEEEFPQWMRELRRQEAILVGAIPISFLFATLTFALIEVFDPSVVSGNVGLYGKIGMTFGLSLGIVIGDIIIRQTRERKDL